MPFSCQQCGECCTKMGYVFAITEEYGNYEYLLKNEYLGDTSRVTVAPEMVPLFEDRSIFESFPRACPFLRIDRTEGKAFCTVHETRPELCRIYGCWRMLILDWRGRRAGRVMHGSSVSFDDGLLRHIWDSRIRDMDSADDEEWQRKVIRILQRFGYTVIR